MHHYNGSVNPWVIRVCPVRLTSLLCAVCALDAAGLEEEESGWKYIHGDVFRFPPMKNLFCAFIGTGTQVRRQDEGRIV